MLIVALLPPPPGSPESTSDGGPNALLVLAIVALILGAVVLVAWLLKPYVAKRLRGHETLTQANGEAASSRWNDSWSRNSDPEDVQDVASSDSEEPSQQLDSAPDTTSVAEVAESITNEASEDVVEEPPVEDSDTADIVAITSTVRTLLERANAGRVREGFSLYSEAALQRFRDEMGLTAAAFDSAFDAVQPPPADQQAGLAAITEVERLPDGRIRALVSYDNGGTYPPPEFFTFVRSTGDEWLIDEIAAA